MKTLYGQRWFKPMEIAKMGLIQNSMGDRGTISGNYDYILELVKSGHIKAKNYSKGQKPYYLIPESEIARYHKTVTNVTTGGQNGGSNQS